MLDGFTWHKQASFAWKLGDRTFYIDPWGLPEDAVSADAIFITHAHFDHLSPQDIGAISAQGTKLFAPADAAAELTGDVTSVVPGDVFETMGLTVQAVPAYNVLEERLDFHPKSKAWVGYVFETEEGARYYHAGDTDHVEELNTVKTDVAFVPIGGTYTMSPSEAAGLVRAISPKVAVPMHYGFVVGEQRDAEVFVQEAAPIKGGDPDANVSVG